MKHVRSWSIALILPHAPIPLVTGLGGLRTSARQGRRTSDPEVNNRGTPRTVLLRNADFATGTYRITEPGKYVFGENIIFQPNPVKDFPHDVLDCCMPLPHQLESGGGTYPDKAFGFGFFAAITVETHDVVIDLNGHTLEQSAEHALMQRFLAHIELGGSPFVPGQGPGDFGPELSPASNVVIKNGVLGTSSHHGIHGNGNEDITVKNVAFEGFEVAALALNNVVGLEVISCTATNRKDVPVLGTFSAGMFIMPFLRQLEDGNAPTTLKVRGVTKSVREIRRDLEASIVRVYDDVVRGSGYIDPAAHPREYALFHNPYGVVDGNGYAVLTNHRGAAVQGFPVSDGDPPPAPSERVVLRDVHIYDLVANINEVVALKRREDGAPMHDPVGAVLQVFNAHPDTHEPITISTFADHALATYEGNVVANAQVLVAKAALDGEIDAARSNIERTVVDWVESGTALSHLLGELGGGGGSGLICNGDSMAHVNKGVVAFKIDGTRDFVLDGCSVSGVANKGEAGSGLCGEYERSHGGATQTGYGGAHVRGYSFAASHGGRVSGCRASGLESEHGPVIGYDVHTDSSHIELVGCAVDGLAACTWGDNVSPLTPCHAFGVHMGDLTHHNSLQGNCLETPKAAEDSTAAQISIGRKVEFDGYVCVQSQGRDHGYEGEFDHCDIQALSKCGLSLERTDADVTEVHCSGQQKQIFYACQDLW